MAMITRPLGAALLLWLTLLFLSIHGWSFLKPDRVAHQPRPTLVARKALANKFNLSNFHYMQNKHHHRHHRHLHRHHRRHHHHHPPPGAILVSNEVRLVPASPSPDDGNEIDPRYGVEKRLVPTGPNPLHH